jgi:uncharacterized protein YndB with AHSA1/START domain
MAGKSNDIVWRLLLDAEPHRVFDLLATDSGRAAFWAERTEQRGEEIEFHFPNGERLLTRILVHRPAEVFALTYFGGSLVRFELKPVPSGTDLMLSESGVPNAELADNRAGWVSVLLNLKAQADFGIDLRNHDPERTWSRGYVDN